MHGDSTADESVSANEWTIEQNRKLLAQLKQENKEVKQVRPRLWGNRGGTMILPKWQLRMAGLLIKSYGKSHSIHWVLQDLAKRTMPATRDAGRTHVDKTVEKLEKAVHGLRRNYDKVLQVRMRQGGVK